MKKYFAFMLAAAAAVVACNKENLENTSNNGNADVKYVDVTLSATIEGQDETKTSVSVDGNKATVSWSSNDQISVFDNSTNASEHNNVFTWNGTEFNGTLPEPGVEAAVYALYPYRKTATLETDGAITTTLNAVQNAVEGTFAKNVAIMVGKVTNGEIAFKNLCSHIKFHLTEDNVKSITLMGNTNEALCGTFQITWNEDVPVVSKITKAETYVTVRNSNGAALSKDTDYYITTLPVKFEEGFTIILSYMDGSQKIKSLSSNVKLERRKISPLSTPASFDEGRVNYFVKYNDGFDIIVGDVNSGGVTFSNTTNPGGVLVNSTKGNNTITKDGVYFLCKDTKTPQVNYNETNGVIFCGVDSFAKACLEINKTLQPATKADGLILFNDIEITPSNSFKNDFISQKKADANPGKEFGSIIFNKCKVTTSRHLIYILNEVIKINKVSIFDCDFFAKSAQSCIVSFGSAKASTITELNITNNIFCPAKGTNVTDFKILQGAAATVNNINLYSNTFDHTIIVNAGCIIVKNIDNCFMMYNLCDEVVGSQASNLGNYKGETTTINGCVKYNYYYTTSSYTLNNALKPTNPDNVGSPAKLTKSPLSTTWDPYNGLYDSYDIVASESSKQPSQAIIGKIGATRTSKAAETTSATANSADYRNGKVDLGTF